MLNDLGKYYEWADNRIIALLEPLEEELFVQVLKGTERSIRDLVEHLVVYYEYFTYSKTKVSFKNLQDKLRKMDKQELLDHWKKVVREFSGKLQGPSKDLIPMPLPKSKSAKVSKHEYLFCFSDHATYHRGQLITTFKEVSRQKGVATDYYDFLISELKT